MAFVCVAAAASSEHAYFDSLAARSDVVHAIAFRSQVDVETYWAPGNPTNRDDVDYDSVVDSMRFRWPETSGGNNIDSMDIDIDPGITSGNVFFTWEDRWSSEWTSVGNRSSINGVSTFKNHHVKDTAAYSAGGLQLEVRKWNTKVPLSDENVPSGEAGAVDIRSYFGNAGGADRLNGMTNDFIIPVEGWVRYFLFIEYGGNGKISLWCTKAGTAPVDVYLQATGDSAGDPGESRRFQFQHNTSSTYSGPTSHTWCRNLVILDGVADLTEAQSLVSQGSLL